MSSRTQGVCCDVELFPSIFYNEVDDVILLSDIVSLAAWVQVPAGTRWRYLDDYFIIPVKQSWTLLLHGTRRYAADRGESILASHITH